MNLLPIALLVSGACQSPIATLGAPQSATAAANAVDMRIYDLAAVRQLTLSGGLAELVFPVLTEATDGDGAFEVEGDSEFPLNLLRSLLAGDFESEDVVVEDLGAWRLLVTAPGAVHQRIAAALAAIDGVLSASVELELCALRLPENSTLSAGLVGDAEARALLDAAGREGQLERLRLRVRTGLPGVLEVGREQTVVADYDVEVAEGVFCFDPVVLPIFLGSRLQVRAAPGREGLFLSLSLRRASALGEPRVVELDRGSLLLAHDQTNRVVSPLAYEVQAVLGRVLALNAFLPEGRALVCVLGHDRSGVREALLVRKLAGGLPAVQRLAGGPGGRALTVLDSSRWAPPVVYGIVREALGRRPGKPPRIDYRNDSLWQACEPWDREIDPSENLSGALERAGLRFDDYSGGWPLLAVALQENPGEVGARLEPYAPEQRNVVVDLQLRRAGASVARLSLTLRAGQVSDALVCSEDSLVGDADVEIAKYASVEDPIQRTVLEGLFVSLEPRFTPAGAIALDLFGMGVVTDGSSRSFDPGMRGMGKLESLSQRYLSVDERLRFDPAGGTGTIQLGDSAGGLMLEVSLRVP